ncbi:MAG: heavy metal translocating P-type ATPase, partial [Candidatus Rokubacteria bacterium]|nr:heavy metal translocating P-type ATPase [Candidatus Rokubacteria bacterium]
MPTVVKPASATDAARATPHPLCTRAMCVTALGGGGILLHLGLRYSFGAPRPLSLLPLAVLLIAGGIPLVIDIVRELLRGNFGADLLAGISILAAVLFGEYLVGAILVLMVSGGVALEQFATRRASSVLDALARRTPRIAHRRLDSGITDVPIREIAIGDALLLFPHEICPVDGVVLDGQGVMDESYLTGEPFVIPKTPGAPVLSGSINGETALTIVAEKLAVDSRYARIMAVVEEAQQHRPRLRRIADRVGVWYTPLAVGVALLGWAGSADPFRFLAVMVIATPCPLLIAVPVAIIGAIALSARRGIIIKNPTVLERIDRCRTLVFDKTGTLTYGRPSLTEVIPAAGFTRDEVLRVAASLEQYSKHPLAGAVLAAAGAAQLDPQPVSHISEAPGDGLRGELAGRRARITGRGTVLREQGSLPAAVPTLASGMECLLFIDDAYAGAFRFHDAPRRESRSFVSHLQPRHGVGRIMLVSGDRESEVRY